MNEMDLLARMRDNAPRQFSPRAEQTFRAALLENRNPERARPAPILQRLAQRGATSRGASRPAWRRLAIAVLPAVAAGAALLLVMLPSGGRPRQGAAPLTAQLLADRAAAAALAGPDITPGQWVYEKLAFTDHFTHQISVQELWLTADDSIHARYVHGKLYKEYNGQGPAVPGGPPGVLEWFTNEPLAYTALGSLPGEPHALISRLGKLGAQLPGPVVGCAESATYCDAFQMITQLFNGYVMPPTVAAKLFKAIGDIPGVTVVPGVTINGQRGVAFRLRLTTGYQQLILNPVTYKPAGGPFYASIVRQELVSGPGARP